LVVLVAVAGVWASVGSGVLASPAFAGGVDPGNQGLLSAAIYNVTPYPWTLVAATSPPGGPSGDSTNCARLESPGTGPGCWDTLPQSIAPGKASVYRLRPWEAESGGICGGHDKYGYDAYITYRVDIVGGSPEYATVAIWGEWNDNICLGPGSDVQFAVFFTAAPPPADYDVWKASDKTPGGPSNLIANPQLTYQHNLPQLYDQSLGIAGNYTVDASTDLGAGFVDLANSLCSGAANTSCSFTQDGPLTWGIGPAVKAAFDESCVVGAGGQRVPAGEPSWAEVEYSASRTASLSIGAGVTASAETNLFGIVSAKISVSLEAETEWTDEQTFTRKSRVFIPANYIANIWVAPVVGKVTGTLVLTFGSSTFTVTNFSEERSGVTRDPMTPAFNVITKMRPMTDSEFDSDCLGKPSAGGLLGGGQRLAWPNGKAPVRLTPGRGVAGVKLGDTQAQVARQLGQPRVKTFFLRPCRGLGPGCDALPGRGGTWSYPQLSVVFGPDWRVTGLSYRGARLSAKRVGVGSSRPALRAAYPAASCARQGKQRLCTLSGTYAKRTVRTVFRFTATRAGRYKCNRVQIYVFDPSTNSVNS
jgi:hypothetical protein